MKKIVSIIIALLIVALFAYACANSSVSEKLEGAWYVQTLVVDEFTYDVSQSSEKTVVEFQADNTGSLYTLPDGEKKSIRWIEDSRGDVLLFSVADDQNISMMKIIFEDANLVISDGDTSYFLSRTAPEDSGIRNGLYAEYLCSVPEGTEGNPNELFESTVSIIQSRLNNRDIDNAVLRRIDENRLRVEIPGLMKSGDISEMISAAGLLEFMDPYGDVFMTGEMISSASYYYSDGDHQVAFTLNDEGSKLFADMTAKCIGETIAIYLDGELLVAPTVQSAITNGSGVINGLGTAERAEMIAAQIQARPLPLELTEQKLAIVFDLQSAKTAASDAKAKKEDDRTVVLKLGELELTKAEALKEIENQLSSNAFMYSLYGYSYDITDPENISAAREAAVKNLKIRMVKEAKILELGLMLTEEDETAVAESARSNYDYAIEYMKEYVLNDSGLEDDELDRAVQEELARQEISLEQYLEEARTEKLNDKLKEYIIRDVTVSEEEIQAEFESRVAAESDTYGETELEDVRESIRADLLADKQDETYDAMIEYWVNHADFEVNLDVLEK